MAKIYLSPRDISLIASFGALSATPLFLTNFFNLVVLTRIPGANGIYIQFLTSLILWVGIGAVDKFGSAVFLFTLSSIVVIFTPGGPPFHIKILLTPSGMVIGLIIDAILLKSNLGVFNRLIAGFAGFLRGLHIVVVQTFLEFPIAIGLPIAVVGCVSGAIGANVGIQILRRLHNNGMLSFRKRA